MPGPTATFEYEYTSQGQPVEVPLDLRPQPVTEEDLDRAWRNVIKPAIQAKYAEFRPDPSS